MEARLLRETLIDTALQMCVEGGYPTTTMAQIAAAAGTTPDDASALFASVDAVVLATVADILQAVVDTLADVPPDVGPVDALHVATTRVVARIAADDGVIPSGRMAHVAQVLTATPGLREQSKALRFEILVPALAERHGVPTDHRDVQHAVTMWSAVIAASYNHGRPATWRLDPGNDGQRPEVMENRLNETFTRVVGRRNPAPPR